MTITVDGQRVTPARKPEVELRFLKLDPTPDPVVIELPSLQPFYAAGGWVTTTPMELTE